MKSKELSRASLVCKGDELAVLMQLASKANYNPKGFECKVYHKTIKLNLGQVIPAYVSKLHITLKMGRQKVWRILARLEAKGLIKKTTFRRGAKNGCGYTLITVGLITGVTPFVTPSRAPKSLETKEVKNTDQQKSVTPSVTLSYYDNHVSNNSDSGQGPLEGPHLARIDKYKMMDHIEEMCGI